MKKTIALLLCLLCMINLSAQQTKILTAEKHNEYGLVYTLPLTAFRIDVTAVKTIYHAGPFYQYSEKYLSTSNVIKEDSESWTIKSIEVTPYGVPDKENRYLMQLKAGATTYIGVDADGMLLSINHDPSKLETNSIVKKNFINGTVTISEPPLDYLKYVNEDFIAAQSSSRKAQVLANELIETREAKMELAKGTADNIPSDGKQLELMLTSLEKQETALMQAFTGYSEIVEVSRSFSFLPEKEERRMPLFRLSDFEGFANPDNYIGEPVYLSLKVIQEAELPVDAKGEPKKLPKDAVIYRIPGTVKLSLSYKGNTLFEQDFNTAQFGALFGLNPALFTDKKEASFALFDSVTGALRVIDVIKE